jgi:hypothetical protein
MNKITALVAASVLLLLQQQAHAATVTHHINTTVKSVSGSTLAGINIGDAIDVYFTYDTDATLASTEYGEYRYENSSNFSIGFQTGAVSFSTGSPGNNVINVIDNEYVGVGVHSDALDLLAWDPSNAGTFAGYDLQRVDLGFRDTIDCNAAGCWGAPNPVPMLDGFGIPDYSFLFQSAFLRLYYSPGAPESSASISLNSGIATVPLPAPILLFLTGLGVLARFSRRGKL